MTALMNLKVLDLSTLLPRPFATMMLADMGAEVLRIDISAVVSKSGVASMGPRF
jgi:crotonobetainyl-CoA:carnitine CoA-transferase CaiB-like acyl-CoA transferase